MFPVENYWGADIRVRDINACRKQKGLKKKRKFGAHRKPLKIKVYNSL